MKRDKDESFEDYKQRRKEDKESREEKLKGVLVWDSKTKGTYRKGE